MQFWEVAESARPTLNLNGCSHSTKHELITDSLNTKWLWIDYLFNQTTYSSVLWLFRQYFCIRMCACGLSWWTTQGHMVRVPEKDIVWMAARRSKTWAYLLALLATTQTCQLACAMGPNTPPYCTVKDDDCWNKVYGPKDTVSIISKSIWNVDSSAQRTVFHFVSIHLTWAQALRCQLASWMLLIYGLSFSQ